MPPPSLTEEQNILLSVVEDITEGELAEHAFEWEGETPWPNLKLLADHDLIGLSIPEAYGGGGMSLVEDALVIETIGRVCPDTAWALVHDALAPPAIATFGSPAAKEHYLPPVVNGDTKIAMAISEPGAGSDATAMNTTIEQDDGDYYLTGEKTWVSAVEDSDASIIWTKFPDGHLGSVIMDFDAPGVEIISEFTNMAGHTQTHFVMENVRIPSENLVISDPAELSAQLGYLNWDRVIIALWTTAAARCAIDRALEYAQTREQFGQPIGEFQGMRWKFADMVTQYEAGRSLAYRMLTEIDPETDTPDRLMSSVTRLFASETTERIVSEALQVFGANGYQQGHPLEYLYRLCRSRRIGHGTDEIMKVGIADRLFKHGLPE